MEYSKDFSDSLHNAFMAINKLNLALHDAIDCVHKSGDTDAIDRLLKASDHLRIVDKTVNHYLHENTDALLKELA